MARVTSVLSEGEGLDLVPYLPKPTHETVSVQRRGNQYMSGTSRISVASSELLRCPNRQPI
jgi:hypothetical protein